MDSSSTTKSSMGLNQNSPFDLIIIGGGINGASIARDATLRGLHVCLIEKNTFGSGTSSRSTKLAHGGLRYLEHFEFSLVHESLRERHLLLQNAPNYVKPLKFVYPIYKNGARSFLKVRCGMWLYSLLAKTSTLPKYRTLNKKELLKQCPLLKHEHLIGGVEYFDAQMKDYELVLANVNDAKEHGLVSYENTTVINLIKYVKFIRINEIKHFQKKITFIPKFYSEINPKVILDNLVSNKILLKIDIEGSEYEIIDEILKCEDKIVCILIEFHNINAVEELFEKKIKNLKTKFEIIHLHGNNHDGTLDSNLPITLEITFVNKKYLKGIDGEKYNYDFPIENLDFPNNKLKPDIAFSFKKY